MFLACAQRLSASLRSSRAGGRRCLDPPIVLNAFRHHCVPHAEGFTEVRRYAQRLSASLRSSPQPETRSASIAAATCSTPFGITAFLTTIRASIRHQVPWCSTPFGITAFLTRTRGGPVVRVTCSTPFGITAFLTKEAHGHFTSMLCSTPFGITAFLTSPAVQEAAT